MTTRRSCLASLATVGLLSGCLGGGSSSSSPGQDEPTANPSPTTSPTPTRPPTPSATPSPSPTPTTTAVIAPVDEPTLEAAILAAVNEARASAVDDRGSIAERLHEMAAYHSERMARERTVSHVIDGETTNDRYEDRDLWCRFPDDVGRLYKHDELEVVGATSTRGVTVDEGARRLVQGWLDDPETRETVLIENADTVGVGVSIVGGRAYVTLVYC